MMPKRTELTDQFGNKMELGVIGVVTDEAAGRFRTVTYGPLEAVGEGARQSWHIVTGTFDYISNLIAGRMKADQLGGPIRVAQASGQMATLGIAALLQLAAMLSVSIGSEPDAGPGAGWRASRFLCHRGRAWKACRPECAGDRLPYRHCARPQPDGLRHLERHQHAVFAHLTSGDQILPLESADCGWGKPVQRKDLFTINARGSDPEDTAANEVNRN